MFCLHVGLDFWTIFSFACSESTSFTTWKFCFTTLYACLGHTHASFESSIELSENLTNILRSCVTYPVCFTHCRIGTHAWTLLPKNCFWNCYKTQPKHQCKLKLYLYRENIIPICFFFEELKYLNECTSEYFQISVWYLLFLYFLYDVDKTKWQHNQILVILRSYNHHHQF